MFLSFTVVSVSPSRLCAHAQDLTSHILACNILPPSVCRASTQLSLLVEMVGAGASMATHNNCIYVFGGMDEERAEHMYLYRWDLSSDIGFEPITYRSATRTYHTCFASSV